MKSKLNSLQRLNRWIFTSLCAKITRFYYAIQICFKCYSLGLRKDNICQRGIFCVASAKLNSFVARNSRLLVHYLVRSPSASEFFKSDMSSANLNPYRSMYQMSGGLIESRPCCRPTRWRIPTSPGLRLCFELWRQGIILTNCVCVW